MLGSILRGNVSSNQTKKAQDAGAGVTYHSAPCTAAYKPTLLRTEEILEEAPTEGRENVVRAYLCTHIP